MLELIHLSGKGGQYPYELSGGMQQRVALARALAIEPRVLLLDEPLSALDAKIRVSLRQEIRAIQRQLGITTVYVTHDQEEALSLSDTVVVMSEGRVEQVGSPADHLRLSGDRLRGPLRGPAERPHRHGASTRPPGASRSVARRSRLATPVAGAVGSRGRRWPSDPRPSSWARGDGTAQRLVGVVEDVQFLGPVIRVRLRLDGEGGTLLFDTFNRPGTVPPELGQRVTVSFPGTSAMVAGPDDGSRGPRRRRRSRRRHDGTLVPGQPPYPHHQQRWRLATRGGRGLVSGRRATTSWP